MAEKSPMTLPDLQAVLDRLQDYAGRDDRLREAFLEVGTAVADVLSLLEKQGPDTAEAIAAALRGIKLELKAPDITINVSPTPVAFEPRITVPAAPAPIIQMMPDTKKRGWDFEVDPKPGGGFTMRARPTA